MCMHYCCILFSQPPVAPKPIVLHLSVTAKVISLLDYVQLHDDLDNHHIDHHALSSKGESIPHSTYQGDLSFQRIILNQILK